MCVVSSFILASSPTSYMPLPPPYATPTSIMPHPSSLCHTHLQCPTHLPYTWIVESVLHLWVHVQRWEGACPDTRPSAEGRGFPDIIVYGVVPQCIASCHLINPRNILDTLTIIQHEVADLQSHLGVHLVPIVVINGFIIINNHVTPPPFCQDVVGASADPCKEDYRGLAPASEKEVNNIMAYFKLHTPIVGAIDIHSYGQLVLRPYGEYRL